MYTFSLTPFFIYFIHSSRAREQNLITLKKLPLIYSKTERLVRIGNGISDNVSND